MTKDIVGNSNLPRHIGFIMDGNRRWARANGVPIFEGHRRGYDKLKEVGTWCLNRGIKHMTVYAFSTENWNRTKQEVDYLMRLLYKALTVEIPEFTKRGIRLRIIGQKDRLSAEMKRAIIRVEAETASNSKGTLYVALNYGGQSEIVDAVRKLINSGRGAEDITVDSISENLYAPEAPALDLIIRTSGEQRLSGFLLWQSAYTELYFIKALWPDFNENNLHEAINWYTGRRRRYGK